MKTLVVALGGNALLQRGEALTAENQYRQCCTRAGAPGPFLSAGDCSRQRAAGGAAGIAESGVERGRTVSAGCAGCGKPGDDWLYAGAEFERTAADAARDDGADAH